MVRENRPSPKGEACHQSMTGGVGFRLTCEIGVVGNIVASNINDNQNLYFFKRAGYETLTEKDAKILIFSDKPLRKAKFGVTFLKIKYIEEGFFIVQDLHYGDYQNIKYFVSIVGLIIFLVLFNKEWRITKHGWRLRHNA